MENIQLRQQHAQLAFLYWNEIYGADSRFRNLDDPNDSDPVYTCSYVAQELEDAGIMIGAIGIFSQQHYITVIGVGIGVTGVILRRYVCEDDGTWPGDD